jgi:hypothetical protein
MQIISKHILGLNNAQKLIEICWEVLSPGRMSSDDEQKASLLLNQMIKHISLLIQYKIFSVFFLEQEGASAWNETGHFTWSLTPD